MKRRRSKNNPRTSRVGRITLMPEGSRQRLLHLQFEGIMLPLSLFLCGITEYFGLRETAGKNTLWMCGNFVGGIFSWTILFDFSKFFLYHKSQWWRESPTVGDASPEPRASTFICVCVQIGLDGGLLLLLMLLSVWDLAPTRDWLLGPWELWTFRGFLGRHAYYSIFAFELKDLWAPGMTVPFWVHHIIVFCGCATCLAVPAGAGLLLMNNISAEFGSGFYNLVNLFPKSRLVLWIYIIMMNLSNFVGLLTLIFINSSFPGLPAVYRIGYSIMCASLLLLRTAGLGLEVRKRFFTKHCS